MGSPRGSSTHTSTPCIDSSSRCFFLLFSCPKLLSQTVAVAAALLLLPPLQDEMSWAVFPRSSESTSVPSQKAPVSASKKFSSWPMGPPYDISNASAFLWVAAAGRYEYLPSLSRWTWPSGSFSFAPNEFVPPIATTKKKRSFVIEHGDGSPVLRRALRQVLMRWLVLWVFFLWW